jgi:hypothetical protein
MARLVLGSYWFPLRDDAQSQQNDSGEYAFWNSRFHGGGFLLCGF